MQVLEDVNSPHSKGWATRIFELIARWTPVQDRYVILVTAMDILVRSPMANEHLQQQLVLATLIDSLLKSDINLIGLSVMDVLLGLVQHVLRVLQLEGAVPHQQQVNGTGIVCTSLIFDPQISNPLCAPQLITNSIEEK